MTNGDDWIQDVEEGWKGEQQDSEQLVSRKKIFFFFFFHF